MYISDGKYSVKETLFSDMEIPLRHGIVSIGRYFSKTDKSADEADCISE